MEYIYEENRISIQNETGKTVAHITFPNINYSVVKIDHTFVSPSLRGKRVAEALLEAVAQKLRTEHKKAYPTCSYAVKWFQAHKEYKDVYIDRLS